MSGSSATGARASGLQGVSCDNASRVNSDYENSITKIIAALQYEHAERFCVLMGT